jgi:hypothetical protein
MVIVPKKTPRRNRRKSRRKSRARDREILRQRRRKILNRIKNQPAPERDVPMITAANIHYELGERVHGLSDGGIGAMVLLARNTGLISVTVHSGAEGVCTMESARTRTFTNG